jgi:membrane-associated phospholipid phosphatase
MGVKNFTELYDRLPANQVAAVPSLHSAYPMLFALFVTGIFGIKKFWWVYVYPVSMWIGVVYMGEHYVIDVILGALYAVLAYTASVYGYNWYYAPRRRMRLIVAAAMVRLRLA